MNLCLTDRWFNPTDTTVSDFANLVLRVDGDGRDPSGVQLMTPGVDHVVTIDWDLDYLWDRERTGVCARVLIDGKLMHARVPYRPSQNGISYVHFYNPSKSTDLAGFSIIAVRAKVK